MKRNLKKYNNYLLYQSLSSTQSSIKIRSLLSHTQSSLRKSKDGKIYLECSNLSTVIIEQINFHWRSKNKAVHDIFYENLSNFKYLINSKNTI